MDESAEELLGEHQGCMRLVARVEAQLREQQGPGFREALLDRVGTLRERLAAHFAGEEAGYMYTRLPLLQPRFSDRLNRLRGEHGGFLEKLDAARTILSGATEVGTSEFTTALNRMRGLLASLRRHEAEENEVLLGAHWDDLGGSGD